MDHSKSDFTQGSILKKLSLFMIPVLGALILQAAYGAVDLLVVGRFGTTAGLSAVSKLDNICGNTICDGNYSFNCKIYW